MAIILRRRKLGRTSCREIAARSKQGILVYRNDQLPYGGNEQGEVVFRWGCTSQVHKDAKVINKTEAIHKVANKLHFREVLEQHHVGNLKTWFNCLEIDKYPVIVRPEYHHQGRQLWLANNIEEVKKIIGWEGPEYYFSPYIKKTEEYRVFVVQGRVVCVAKKTPANPDAIAWNVYQGGRFDNVHWNDWPLKAVRIALEAFRLSGLDFGGVDVMLDKEGKVYVLEINSAPSLTSPYRQEAFAKAFDYIIVNGKDSIPLVEKKGDYKKFIHPAIFGGALVP